jgi:hypothetical protein
MPKKKDTTEKTWIIKDDKGKPPSAADVEQIRRWFTRDDDHPIVLTSECADRVTWRFVRNEIDETLQDMKNRKAEAEAYATECNNAIEALKLMAEARDIEAIRKFVGVE